MLSPHPRRLRYDNVGGLVVDGCHLAHALFGKQDVHYHARLAKRFDLGGVLAHNIVERERLAIGELGCNLLGKCLVKLGFLARRLGLGSVLLVHVVLMRNLAVKVLDRMNVCLIGIAQNLTNEVIGHALGATFGKDCKHLIVSERKLSASGSHS